MGFQKKVNVKNVLFFLRAYYELEDFNSAPAGEKVIMLKKEYSVDISEHTCRDWTKRLLSSGFLTKGVKKVLWRTALDENGKLVRQKVSGNPERLKERKQYFERLIELRNKYADPQLRMSILWDEFDCTYYCCEYAETRAWVNGLAFTEDIKEAIRLELEED